MSISFLPSASIAFTYTDGSLKLDSKIRFIDVLRTITLFAKSHALREVENQSCLNSVWTNVRTSFELKNCEPTKEQPSSFSLPVLT